MSALLTALVALQAAFGITTIGGLVVGPDGSPIPHAQVFLEPGLGGGVVDTISDASGHFEFEDVSPGPAGIFAIAPGYGFEGQHLSVAVADEIPPVRLALHPATQISGTITSHDGKALADARITRIGIKSAHKVGVPLAKLKRFGYLEPKSDGEGHFVLENVPEGCTVDLKVGHARFAQEGVRDVAAGTDDLRIALYPGILLEGVVISRSSKKTIGQAAVLIQNAQPPHDTALARSNLQGKFSLRLKPGVYVYRATGAGLRSPGWERLTITGERTVEHLRLAVAGTGQIRGNVRDALSGEAIRGVRISLTTNGTRAAVARTGPSGDFRFVAGEGENIIRVDASPGYSSPESQNMKVSILEGASVELPGMWLKPLPAYSVAIIDEEGNPVPGALVSVLRPVQFGWHVANDAGQVALQIQTFPESGKVLGRVEHPVKPMGALFSLEKHQEAPAIVQLFPLASVSGQVVNARGRSVGGAMVGAFFPGESATDAVLLWQTLSTKEGAFRWDAVVPGVPQRCVARLGKDAHGESMTFNLSPAENKSLGDVVVSGGKAETTLFGEAFSWHTLDLQCGELPGEEVRATRPTLLLYTDAARAIAVAESAEQIQKAVGDTKLIVAVIAAGPVSCSGATPVPILLGKPPSSATTLLLDRSGKVVLESAGLPPISVLRQRF